MTTHTSPLIRSFDVITVHDYPYDGAKAHTWELPSPHEWLDPLHGLCLYCGHCGHIWCRKFNRPANQPLYRPDYWEMLHQSCYFHGNGSVFENLFAFDAFLRLISPQPADLLRREFLAATKRKEPAQCNTSQSSNPSTI